MKMVFASLRSLLLVFALISQAIGQDCSPCGGCLQCEYAQAAYYWKACGSNDYYWESPQGTTIVIYVPGSSCQPCSTDRLNGRESSTATWGFVAKGDITNCNPVAEFPTLNSTATGCPALNQWHDMATDSYLRNQPEGYQCGMLQPGVDRVYLYKADQYCGWCYGQAEGPICSGINPNSGCGNCLGWMMCSALAP